LHEQASTGATIVEKLEAYANVAFAVVLLTPDDVGGIVGGPQNARARQNVVLELGYFLGRLGRKRTCALVVEGIEIPSDFSGGRSPNQPPKNALAVFLEFPLHKTSLAHDSFRATKRCPISLHMPRIVLPELHISISTAAALLTWQLPVILMTQRVKNSTLTPIYTD
jgi:hypothetical protein